MDEGADVGEIVAIANDMKSTDDSAFYDAWYSHAARHRGAAEDADRQGKRHTARYHYLRATVYAGVSYKPLFGAPVDHRVATAARGYHVVLVDGRDKEPCSSVTACR